LKYVASSQRVYVWVLGSLRWYVNKLQQREYSKCKRKERRGLIWESGNLKTEKGQRECCKRFEPQVLGRELETITENSKGKICCIITKKLLSGKLFASVELLQKPV
jgi:hypothetical protein